MIALVIVAVLSLLALACEPREDKSVFPEQVWHVQEPDQGGEEYSIVLVGTGFDSTEREEFRRAARDFVSAINADRVMRAFKSYVRVTCVFPAGVANGPADRDGARLRAIGDSAQIVLDDSGGVRLASPGMLLYHAKRVIPERYIDVVLVVAKMQAELGGAHIPASYQEGIPLGVYSYVDARIALHELGHMIGRLSDEYPSGCIAGESGPNVAWFDLKNGDSAELPWSQLWYQSGADGHVLAHAVNSDDLGDNVLVSSWPQCRMRDARYQFCPVCSEQMYAAMSVACGLKWSRGAFLERFPLSLWE